MPAIGDTVIIRALNARGVVTAVIRPGVYRVQVGALMMTARDDEIAALPAARKKKRRADVRAVETGIGEEAAPEHVAASIDLHGLTVDEARNRVAGHISQAILAGLDRVEIVHGIGTGRLKAVVTKDLKALPVVRAVTPHPTNPGVTIAYLA